MKLMKIKKLEKTTLVNSLPRELFEKSFILFINYIFSKEVSEVIKKFTEEELIDRNQKINYGIWPFILSSLLIIIKVMTYNILCVFSTNFYLLILFPKII